MAVTETCKIGEKRLLKEGVLPSDLALSFGEQPEVKVLGMEHRYGYNRFVMVELPDGETVAIVSPGDLI